jgi:uncharacterized protein
MQRSRKKVLLKAVESGDLRRLRALLDQGVDPDFQNTDGETLLMLAMHRGHVDTANMLLDAGADVHLRSNDGATALFWAARYGYLELVERLLAAGANVYAARDRRDNTPLAAAVGCGHVAVVRTLIKHGADPEQSYLGESLTYFAEDDEMRRVLARCRRRTR